MAVLKIYNKEKELILVSQEFTGDKGWGLLTDLIPYTTYEEGTYFVSWEDKNYETELIPVPKFKTESSTNKELVFYFKDALTVKPMTAYDIAVKNGFSGTEKEWVESIKGEKGDSGLNLTQGGSAYEYALDNGFEGTVEEWLESLKGDKGEQGKQGKQGTQGKDGINGKDGIDGNDGLSAYQIAKEYGYNGTEQEWLDSLKLSATNQQMEDIKSQIVNSINKPTIINTPTCASRDRVAETDMRRLKDYGLQFTSFVDGYITSFDVFSSGDGVTDFYLTDYGGYGIPANVEYKRIRRKLSAGWNTIEFVNKIESNKEYCIAVSFTDDISLAVGSAGTYDDVNIQNPHLIKPNRAYRPLYGQTGTAYLFIFNMQISIDNDSRLILNQLTNNTFEVSNVEPSNDTSIWIKPQSNGG
ncbi:lipase acylhydrolase domain protein [Staphylococcus phage vB_SurM-PSU4]|nr:lipase acylhydrolase domain protein [Staphylococcus phage vB_SurM-PSU4]